MRYRVHPHCGIRVAQKKHVSPASTHYHRYWNVYMYVHLCTQSVRTVCMYIVQYIPSSSIMMLNVSSLPMQTINFIVQTWWHGTHDVRNRSILNCCLVCPPCNHKVKRWLHESTISWVYPASTQTSGLQNKIWWTCRGPHGLDPYGNFVGAVQWSRYRFYTWRSNPILRGVLTSPRTEIWIDFVLPAWLGNLDPGISQRPGVLFSCRSGGSGSLIGRAAPGDLVGVATTNLDTKGIHFSPPLCGGNGGEDWIPGD